MAVKLSSLMFSRRIPRRVCFNASLSSLSCAKDVETFPETEQNPSQNSSEFESKIESLKNNLHPDTLVNALDSSIDVNSSLKLFKWASFQKRFKHNADTYYKMIFKLGMSRNIEEMEGFCNEMVKAKCVGFNEVLLALINSFVQSERFDEALRVLFCLNSSGFKPSRGVFNVLMGELLKVKRDIKDVLFVYKELVKAGIVPDVETLNYLLEALLEDNRVDTSLKQYRSMSKKGCSPNSRTFEVLISGLIAKDQVDEAMLILNEMFALGCELDLCFFNHVIPLLCRIDEMDACMRLFAKMRASKHPPDLSIYDVIIQGLCQNLLVDDAVKLFKEKIDGGLTPDKSLYIDIVNGFCKLDRFEEAKLFLDDHNVEEICPYNTLLGAYCYAGKFVSAKSLFYEMFERNITDCLSWNILIECLCETGEIKKAFEVLGRMILTSLVPDSDAYFALIVGKCRRDELDDALVLANQVKRKGWMLDSSFYDELVECLCRNKKIQEAVEMFRYMAGNKSPLGLNSFNILVNGVCNTGDVQNAISLTFVARSCGMCCSAATYNAIMKELSKSEKSDSLLVMLSQMVVNGCSANEETYCILIQSMSLSNQAETSTLFFNLMISHGLLPSSEALASLLACLGRYCQVHKILSAVDTLIFNSHIFDSSNFNMLLSGLWKEGYKSEASRYLDIMLGKGWVPNTTAHSLLMGSVVQEHNATGKCADEASSDQDEITSILTEALTEN